MFKLKRETDLGLLLLEELGHLNQGEYLSLLPWTKKRHLPYRFLSKVAHRLKVAGLVIAKEGKAGGYRLAQAPPKIRLDQVLRSLEGDLALTRCGRGLKCSCLSFCRHRRLMDLCGSQLEKSLRRLSLQSLYAQS